MARRSLPESTKQGILKDLAAGVNKAIIAKTWGVSIPTVYNFLKRQAVASETVGINVGNPDVEQSAFAAESKGTR